MMNEQKSFPWLPVLLGVGCVSALCIGVLLVGGGATYFITRRSEGQPISEVFVTEEPSAPPSASGLTGNQQLEEHALYDDFSSDALGWPVYDDGKTITKYENQTYSIQVTEREDAEWAFFPVDFIPNEIGFDVQAAPGHQDGSFGVLCQYQDYDNHYYVEFDLESNEYRIAQWLDGENIPLTKQNSVGQFWYETDAFNSPPTSVNHIDIRCYLESITLTINDQLVDQVYVPTPFDQSGEAAFFVYTFSYADQDGYKVFFDNVDVYQLVQ
jgi:hypothetical protein